MPPHLNQGYRRKDAFPASRKGSSQGECGEHAHPLCAAHRGLASSVQIWCLCRSQKMFNPFPHHFETREPAQVSLSQPLPSPRARTPASLEGSPSIHNASDAGGRITMAQLYWLGSTTHRTGALVVPTPRYPSGLPPKPP